jgi:predicted dehydrogenase
VLVSLAVLVPWVLSWFVKWKATLYGSLTTGLFLLVAWVTHRGWVPAGRFGFLSASSAEASAAELSTAWDVQGDPGDDAPLATSVDSGAADPMAISLEPIKRQFLDFGNAVTNKTKPLLDGEEGFRALQIVLGVYESARSGKPVSLT